MTAEPRTPRASEFYRQCRLWHGYLSAFSFLALIFFAGTGITLNHADFTQMRPPMSVEKPFTLTPAEIAALRSAPDPAPVLMDIAGKRIALQGRLGPFEGNDVIVEDQAFLRLQGVRGGSEIRANLRTGAADVVVERQYPVEVINGLHRADRAGPVWRAFVDLIAVIMIVLAVVGFALFLSMRYRLRTALMLAALSLVTMVGLFFATVH